MFVYANKIEVLDGTNRMLMTDKQWAEAVRDKIRLKMAAQCDRVGSKVPYIAVDGHYGDKMADNLSWWTNGFWPGILWLMFRDTKDQKYSNTAIAVEERLDAALAAYEGLHHDVGFMWTLSAGLDFKLTGNPRSRARALHAANLLAGRYNPRGHFIRSWNGQYTGWIIVDCMMNLPLLYWAGEQSADPRYRFIAIEHADTALKHLVRNDGSCNHIAVLDPENGDLLETPAGQGYASGSSWTRGQAWALYGFALNARHTGEERYLAASKRIAHYFISALTPYGFVPPVDFRAPDEPEKIDTSAGVIASCGLLELAELAAENERKIYFDAALKILKATESKYCDWDPSRDSIVQKGTAQYHDKPEEFHVPLIYGDYFFIEAVYRLLYPESRVW
ncbi:glycosyl hydrolase family 88 [Spirochaetia bacterium]|nr:glycosyl hydrolase family 88 [Spirochaetia bacterium]